MSALIAAAMTFHQIVGVYKLKNLVRYCTRAVREPVFDALAGFVGPGDIYILDVSLRLDKTYDHGLDQHRRAVNPDVPDDFCIQKDGMNSVDFLEPDFLKCCQVSLSEGD